MLIQKILGRYQNSHKMVNKFRQWIIVVMSVIFTVNNNANDMVTLRGVHLPGIAPVPVTFDPLGQ